VADEPKVAEPLPLMSEEDITKHARSVVTNLSLLADARDRDWQHSLMLLLCGLDPVPPNASNLFVVPMGPHMSGRWLNGKVPGVTISATMVPVENAEALVAKIMEFDALLNPEPTDG
jgi:hypothetical protein